MKNIKNIVLLTALFPLFFACEESQTYNGDARVKFGGASASVDVTPADLVYKLEVQLVSAPLKQDVVCEIFVNDEKSTAVQGVDFVLLSSTVTIPAGQNLAYVEVKCLYEGLSDGERRAAVFGLKGPEGITAIPSVNEFSLSMMMKCPFMPEDFEGTFVVVDKSGYETEPYDPYEVELTLVSFDAPNRKAVFESVGLWMEDIAVEIILQEYADGTYHVSIPKQDYMEHPTYGMIWMESRDDSGTFSPCEVTITANYKVYVDAGFFDQVTSSQWTKKR